MHRYFIGAIFSCLCAAPALSAAGTMPVACSTLYAPAVIPGAHHAVVTIHRMYFVPTASGTWHSHPGVEYLTVVDGNASLHIKGQAPIALSPNSVAVVPMGAVHRVVNTSKTAGLSFIGFEVETSKMQMQNERSWTPMGHPQARGCPPAH